MTVWENLMSLLETRKELTPAQRKEKAEALLDEFHIGHVKDTQAMPFPAANGAAWKSPGP